MEHPLFGADPLERERERGERERGWSCGGGRLLPQGLEIGMESYTQQQKRGERKEGEGQSDDDATRAPGPDQKMREWVRNGGEDLLI